MSSISSFDPNAKLEVRWTGYVALAFALVFFSGIFMKETGALRALDFSLVSGSFGSLGKLTEGSGKLASNFRGTGGTGTKEAWMFALTIAPQIMFALGFVKVVESLDGLKAAQKLLTPFMRIIMGVPGMVTLAAIAGMQNGDTGASMAKQMYDQNMINDRERLLFISFHFPAGAVIVNFFAIGAMVFPLYTIPAIIPLFVILFCRLIGTNIFRFFILNRMLAQRENGNDNNA